MNHRYLSSVLAAATALGIALPATSFAQDSNNDAQAKSQKASSSVLEEVVVNARRRDEALQDVAASISVFSQKKIENANIVNAGDLATYTPSLQANSRFGGDNTTFAIRGFSQELRTTASVGTYFAEVVAPRGANTQQSGDGAGPGDFFDLQNVQVLKGPQGTLFGRNTTGGAVLLVPQKPTDELEGYIEGSVGNYNMGREQGVLNVPITDNFKIRLGIDHQERDGYLDNFSGIGPDHFADVQYTAYRLSALWDITDSLENYTIIRSSESNNNGYPASLFYCNKDAPLGALFCEPDLKARQAAGKDGQYDIYNFIPKPINEQRMSQIINTTTWTVNDGLTVKNIMAYATLQTRQRSSIYGTNWYWSGAPLIFQMVGVPNNGKTTDQDSYVEELQLQGNNPDINLTWQGGLYYEKSKPGSDYGAQSAALISCEQSTITSSNPADFRCNNTLGAGALQSSKGGVDYTNKAIYAQATYDINYEFSVTAGLRYTMDDTKGHVSDNIYYFPTIAGGSYTSYDSVHSEIRDPKTSSKKATWLMELDYKPNDDTLLYGKYNRGYRQGSVNLAGTPGLDTHKPETVDTFEIGSKSTFRGSMPATLNLAAFYNDFTNQQIQYGYFKTTGVGTTAIVNAGSSTIWGIEAEGNIQLTDSVVFNASYAYLNTNVDKLTLPYFPPSSVGTKPTTTTAQGEPLSYTPENKLVLTATWLLPVSVEMGDMRLSATYTFTDKMQAAAKEYSKYATLPSYELFNLNFNWDGVMGTPVDASLFVTNVTDEEYKTFSTGNWDSGFEFGQVGQPRMYGARVRYNF